MTAATLTATASPIPEPALAPADAARVKRPLSLPMMLLGLTALTGVAAFLRYWRIDHQAYWTDEGYTIERVRGSWQHMMSSLTDQGFPPGWYVLLRGWCQTIEKITHNGALAFSPVSTRGLTALFGTLTVPMMYLLGRQFTDRRGALLVTLLAAVNPFLIYYSRDIKMYAPFWFFVVANMAFFFQWLKTPRMFWLLRMLVQFCWFVLFVLTGAAMTALHPMAWFIPGLQLVFLLTRPRPRAFDAPLWVIAAGAMCVFPAYWYYVYLPHQIWLGRVSATQNMGMGWLTRYTDMSWTTLGGLVTEHLGGYLWPVNPPDQRITTWFVLGTDFKDHLATRTDDRMARWEMYVGYALFAIMLLGLIPWRGLRRSDEQKRSATRGRWWWVAVWIAVPVLALVITWVPHTSFWYTQVWHRISPSFDPKPLWEPRYLGIIVPAWILWMAAALRRLPTWPVRTVAVGFVVAASVFSSLSNHLIYRNAPYNRAAAIAEQFTDKKNREATVIGMPYSAYSQPAEDAEYAIARGVRPGSSEDTEHMGSDVWDKGYSPSAVTSWVSEMRNKPGVRVIVLTDKWGDLVDAKEPLSDESLNAMLGPQWKLVHTESYRWHYEWRFYIFHTWRTRVWQRIGEPPRPAATRPPAGPGLGERLRGLLGG